MRVVVTGGAGFIGRAVVKKLASGGVDVVALVRDPAKATYLDQPHVTLVQSDLTDVTAMAATMAGADGVIHAAGSYRVGIPAAERPKMLDANLGTTERVLDAAIKAGVRKIVYVSTVAVFGDTGGKVVDETYRRDITSKRGAFLAYYDETKFRAHMATEERIAQGAPIVIVQPSQVYGPNDHSQASERLDMAFHGTMPYRALTENGLGFVHVDDLAEGIVAALIRGRVGQSYVLAGTPIRAGDAQLLAARLGGHRLPRRSMPTSVLRVLAILQRRGLKVAGAPPDLAETIRASVATYWASSAKATKELGFSARPLEQGIKDTWGTAT